MKRVYWHVAGRFYQARAARALKAYVVLLEKSEIFFNNLKAKAKDPEE